MTIAGTMIGLLIFYALVAPKSFGRWLAVVASAYDSARRGSAASLQDRDGEVSRASV